MGWEQDKLPHSNGDALTSIEKDKNKNKTKQNRPKKKGIIINCWVGKNLNYQCVIMYFSLIFCEHVDVV